MAKGDFARLLAVAVVVMFAELHAQGGAFVTGNLLVARERYSYGEPTVLHEYTPAGVRVQTITVSPQTEVRGLTIDDRGRAVAFIGTFSPSLWIYNPTTGTATTQQFAGWSSVNDSLYGGLDFYSHYAYATDMTTGGGEANGIIRFDLSTGSAQRFNSAAPSNEYRQLKIGRDGLLYALEGGYSPEPQTVDVYNPATMALIRSIGIPAPLDALAVAANGDVFTVQSDGWVIHYNSSLHEIKRLDITFFGAYSDIALSPNGKIVVGSASGMVVETDTSLSGYTKFHAGYNDTNNSLGDTSSEAVAFVPEPGSGSIVFLSLGAAAGLGRRRRHLIR